MLVTLIRLIHFGLIVGIILSIFIPSIAYKKVILAILILLFLQYIFSWGRCSLTELEYMILGENEYKNGFIYRIVNPIITVNEAWFDCYLYLIHLLLIVILIIQIKN